MTVIMGLEFNRGGKFLEDQEGDGSQGDKL
jgi:hypothetical protein